MHFDMVFKSYSLIAKYVLHNQKNIRLWRAFNFEPILPKALEKTLAKQHLQVAFENFRSDIALHFNALPY